MKLAAALLALVSLAVPAGLVYSGEFSVSEAVTLCLVSATIGVIVGLRLCETN